MENESLVLDLLEWIGAAPRAYQDVMDAWRTSCPRLTIWEDALEAHLLAVRGQEVRLTAAGSEFLGARRDERRRRMSRPPATGSESTADREFVHSRLVDAPRERVFKAFADPTHLARWWGPDGFTNTFESFELRPGGFWRFVMHGPDGADYPNESVFIEVSPPERVVFEHLSETHHFLMTITFTAQAQKTLVGWRQVFDTAEQKEQVAGVVAQANEQNLDRLANEVRHVR